MGSRGKKKKSLPPVPCLPGWDRRVQDADNGRSLVKNDLDQSAAHVAREVKDLRDFQHMIRETDGLTGRDAAFRRSVEARIESARLIEQSKALKDRMEEAWEEGRQAGFKQAAWPIIKCCMAGACLMLQETFGMDEDQIVEGLTALNEKITWALTYSELAEDVLNKTGIELRIDDPLEPIRRKESQ